MDLVFDIGGTFLRVAPSPADAPRAGPAQVFDTPNFFELASLDTATDNLAHAIISAAERVAGAQEIGALCLAFPGPVDDRGNILAAPTVWGRQAERAVPLASVLERKRPGWRVRLVNDVTAAGHFYVTPERRDFLIVTVGSGVGSKLFLNGRPVLGQHFRGGELGHLKADFSADAPLCDCGERGHVGAISSGRGVLRAAQTAATADADAFHRSALFGRSGGDARAITNDHVVAAFLDGDPWVADLLAHSARPLAQGLASLHLLCGVERFIVIGGFAQAMGRAYSDLLAGLAATMTWRNGFDWQGAILPTNPADNPGLNGAHRLLHAPAGPAP